MLTDKTLLAWQAREKYLKEKSVGYAARYWGSDPIDGCLVVVQRHDGKIHGACISINDLGPNGVLKGHHAGLLWWPEKIL